MRQDIEAAETGADSPAAREHDNAFGFVRLAFASLVILSHTAELVDGNRDRELLWQLTGTTTFASLAVDGFFIVSGFLITASFLASASIWHYLWKRVIRIYPAFIACSLVCLLLIGPLTGGGIASLQSAVRMLVDIALLEPPEQAGAFAGNPLPVLNGAAWTIQYEFLCYLGVVALGVTGVLRRPALVVLLCAGCLVVSMLIDTGVLPGAEFRGVRSLPRLGAMFLAGAAFQLYGDRIPMGRGLAPVAVAGFAVCLFVAPLLNTGVAVCGAWLIFVFARWGGGTFLRNINNRDDISYGLYLYAWPIQNLLIFWGLTSLWPLGILTWMLAALAGALSWLLLEKPVLRNLKSWKLAGRASPAM